MFYKKFLIAKVRRNNKLSEKSKNHCKFNQLGSWNIWSGTTSSWRHYKFLHIMQKAFFFIDRYYVMRNDYFTLHVYDNNLKL